MLVHPSHRENSGTLLNALVYYLNQNSKKLIRPGLIHRLDKQTSGLMVVAKNARAHRILSGHFMKKRVEKRYLALVEGVLKNDQGTIDAPIGRFADLKHWSVKSDGKHSESKYKVRERFADTTNLLPGGPTSFEFIANSSATRSSATQNAAAANPNVFACTRLSSHSRTPQRTSGWSLRLTSRTRCI
jgi:hypothetical protein